jgi:hypothetical protein
MSAPQEESVEWKIINKSIEFIEMLLEPVWSQKTMSEIENIEKFVEGVKALKEFKALVNKNVT